MRTKSLVDVDAAETLERSQPRSSVPMGKEPRLFKTDTWHAHAGLCNDGGRLQVVVVAEAVVPPLFAPPDDPTGPGIGGGEADVKDGVLGFDGFDEVDEYDDAEINERLLS